MKYTNHPGQDTYNWDTLPPIQVLSKLVYELYAPVSLISTKLNRITEDNDPLTEEEYEMIFVEMQKAVDQLSKKIVRVRQYVQNYHATEEAFREKP